MSEIECGFLVDGITDGDRLVSFGPTLPIRIGFDVSFRPGSQNTPNIATTLYPALVDTGASESCIDSGVASLLGLPIVDRVRMAGVNGSEEFNMHAAQIYIPGLNFCVYGRFAGAHLLAGGQPHQALLGRTFLQHFSMVYDGSSGSVIIRR